MEGGEVGVASEAAASHEMNETVSREVDNMLNSDVSLAVITTCAATTAAPPPADPSPRKQAESMRAVVQNSKMGEGGGEMAPLGRLRLPLVTQI
ncbi:hypothetical protein E2562_020614 [Oryza meyeriana var. granulata]|uniref:Uncharacterized protein n=1 Tax=Oryza meyeriana var. granulata TaxID=110450 RepID=A0A6G1DZ36_9ORYZ|nr:hypothetical protein E2562_020614 [Oryza meyeriana var. granulata]